jgi:hypothetical protein
MSEPAQNHEPSRSSVKISKPALKFFIGFFGGLCAALFPRLMAALAVFDSESIVVLNLSYIGLAVIFALLVGAVVMIMEWGVAKEPRATFMSALGVPALIAGALNTTSGANNLNALASVNEQSAAYMQNMNDIPDLGHGGITPLSDASDILFDPFTLIGVGTAEAADGFVPAGNDGFDPSMHVQKQYVIVLDQAASAEDAKQKANSLLDKVPNAQAVKSGNNYLVIDRREMSRQEAVVNAIRLKREKNLAPSLMQVK